jgi:hypothetical protein
MTPRPVRSQIYLPVLRFGITDEDWGFVILASILGYAIPFLLDLKFYNVPLELVGWAFTMGVSILVLNLIRRKSRPGWLKHVIQAAMQGNVCRRRMPGEVAGSWIKEEEE